MFEYGTRMVRRCQDCIRVGVAMLVTFSVRLGYIYLSIYVFSAVGWFSLDAVTIYTRVYVCVLYCGTHGSSQA